MFFAINIFLLDLYSVNTHWFVKKMDCVGYLFAFSLYTFSGRPPIYSLVRSNYSLTGQVGAESLDRAIPEQGA
jgi:hypothetical protein